jgi:SPP1 gp7 family putative phage head morphogenesis protein
VAVTEETLRLSNRYRVTLGRTVNATTRDLVRAWAAAWDEIQGTWVQAMADVTAASQDGRWPTITQLMRQERAQEAMAAANEQIRALAEYTGVTVTDVLGPTVGGTPDEQARLIASQMPAQAGTRAELVARFNRVDPFALDAIVRRSTQQVTAATYRLERDAQEAMRRTLIRGVAVGDNPKAAARRMVRLVEGEFNGGLTRAMTIARTEILDAHRAGTAESQIANDDVLQGWQWVAQLDKRTCSSCWAQHGKIHPLTEQGPMDHQNGRCARSPANRPWADLGFNIPEPPSLLPDAQATFGTLSRADQLAVMGPTRLRLLDGGVIGWNDLSTTRRTPGWRDSQVPTPVRNLLARAA